MKTVRERIVDALRDHPEGLSESALAKEVDANRGVVHKACDFLEDDGQIHREWRGELGTADYARIHRLVDFGDGRSAE